VSASVEGVPVVGTSSTIIAALEATGADTLAVGAWSDITQTDLRRLSWELEGSGVSIVVAPSVTDVTGPRIHIRPVAGLPLLHLEQPEFTGARRLLKGTTDRLAAALVLLLLGPLLLSFAIAVRLTSPGPALFRQTRVGEAGHTFTIYKFRSMFVDAETRLAGLQEANEAADGLLFKIRDDPRITPLGRWLRRISLDELPQLLNVVKGDMSLVHARHCRVRSPSTRATPGGGCSCAGPHRPVAGQRQVGPVVGRGRAPGPALRRELVARPGRDDHLEDRLRRSAATGCLLTPVPAAVLFDMDGLLVDTEPVWTVAEHELAARLGGVFTEEIKAAIVGTRLEVAVPLVVRACGVDPTPAVVVDCTAWLLARMVELYRQGAPLLPGAATLLDAVRAAGVPVALVSSSYRVLVDAVLDTGGLGAFDVTVAGDEVVHGKPDPEPYVTAAARLGVATSRCVVLEDAPSRVASAEAAGCAVVAVPSVPGVSFRPGPRRRVLTSLLGLTVADLGSLSAAS
jgi:HAD superfamily hydrolase (TIGR01509 family)